MDWVPTFSTREIAVGAWIAVLGGWAVSLPGVRRSLAGLARALVGWKLLLPALLMAGYTALVCWRLQVAGFWAPFLLKDTILWFCFSGLSLGFAFGPDEGSASWWRRTLVDQLKVVVLLEYLVNTYTFSLPAELALQPICSQSQ